MTVISITKRKNVFQNLCLRIGNLFFFLFIVLVHGTRPLSKFIQIFPLHLVYTGCIGNRSTNEIEIIYHAKLYMKKFYSKFPIYICRKNYLYFACVYHDAYIMIFLYYPVYKIFKKIIYIVAEPV